MKQRDRDITINEKQVINSKITNDKVLRFAMNLGLISPENYDCMKVIGRSKQVGELMKEMSINTIDAITSVLHKMLRKGLISIEDDGGK